MKFHIVSSAIIIAVSLAGPIAARAQGIPDGVFHGASVGSQAAGPIGAVVGGAVGGVVGGVEGGVKGILGIQPIYAAYPQSPAPQVYRYHHAARHSSRHGRGIHPSS